jgi:hypothetical protein
MIPLNITTAPHIQNARAGNREPIMLFVHAGLSNGYSNYSTFGTIFAYFGILPSIKPSFDPIANAHNNDDYYWNIDEPEDKGCYKLFAFPIVPRGRNKKWKAGRYTFLLICRNVTHHGTTLVTVDIPTSGTPGEVIDDLRATPTVSRSRKKKAGRRK